jgi:selenocysteine lyase/cysteine desulfurase
MSTGISDSDNEAAGWSRIRKDFPCTSSQIYLNTGTLGPVPEPVMARYLNYIHSWNSDGPGDPVIYRAWHERTERTRKHLAAWLHVDPTTIALTGNVTDAINIGLTGLDLQPGSRVLTTDDEHGAMVAPLGLLTAAGVTVDIVPYGDGGDSLLDRIAHQLRKPTDLVVLSHVSCDTGAWVDGQKLADLAHTHDALLMLDGAQSVGQLPVDLASMGVDLYALNGHKWLLGPVGTGALYVAPHMAGRVHMHAAGSDSAWTSDYPKSVTAKWGTAASRFEYATRPWTSVAAWDDALSYWESIGVERALARQRRLATALRRRLETVPGAYFGSPADPLTGITAVGMDGWHGSDLAAALRTYRIVGRPIGRRWVIDGVRLSTSFFNNDDDIEAAVQAFSSIANAGPEEFSHDEPAGTSS